MPQPKNAERMRSGTAAGQIRPRRETIHCWTRPQSRAYARRRGRSCTMPRSSTMLCRHSAISPRLNLPTAVSRNGARGSCSRVGYCSSRGILRGLSSQPRSCQNLRRFSQTSARSSPRLLFSKGYPASPKTRCVILCAHVWRGWGQLRRSGSPTRSHYPAPK